MKTFIYKKNKINLKKVYLILAISIGILIDAHCQNTGKTSPIRWISPPEDSLIYGKGDFMLKFCINTKAKYDSINVFFNDKFYTIFASNIPSTNSCKNDFEKDFTFKKGINHLFITTKTDQGDTYIESKSIFYEPPTIKKEKEIVKSESIPNTNADSLKIKPASQTALNIEEVKKVLAENLPPDTTAKIIKPQVNVPQTVGEPEKIGRNLEKVQQNESLITPNINKSILGSNTSLLDTKVVQNGNINDNNFEESFEESSQSSSSSSSSSRRGAKRGMSMPNTGATTTENINSAPKATSINEPIVNEKRIALVIGNSNYLKSPLKNPSNDAYIMGDQLRKLGFEVSSLPNATLFFMKKAIADFGKELAKDKNTVGLFYYAGHGMQVNGKNYIVPIDAKIDGEDEVFQYCVDLDGLLSALENAANTMNIIILDACRNDPFGNGRDLGGKGLATINAPTGTIIAFATAPGAIASDGESTNGLYTKELVKVMDTPDVKLEDVFKRVRSEVRKTSNGSQIPWENSSIEGDFYFKR